MHNKFDSGQISAQIPKKLRPARSLAKITRTAADRDQVITEAYRTITYSLTEIANDLGLHRSAATRIARQKDQEWNRSCSKELLENRRFSIFPLTPTLNMDNLFD